MLCVFIVKFSRKSNRFAGDSSQFNETARSRIWDMTREAFEVFDYLYKILCLVVTNCLP